MRKRLPSALLKSEIFSCCTRQVHHFNRVSENEIKSHPLDYSIAQGTAWGAGTGLIIYSIIFHNYRNVANSSF